MEFDAGADGIFSQKDKINALFGEFMNENEGS